MLNFVHFLIIFQVCYCERRIRDGKPVSVDKRYVVYLVKAPASELIYDYWLCGGAIVSEEFVITSAACVNDVDYLYVISGYREYVTDDQIENNPCTREMKKKIIYTCSPKGYFLKYNEIDYWSYIDIALAKVESPFDFTDTSYEKYCSYIPTTIAINYDPKYQEAGTDTLALGWGHNDSWRRPGDSKDYNQKYLTYAPLLLYSKESCKERFVEYPNMTNVIEDYMICALGSGNVDDAGETIQKSMPISGGCTTLQQKVLGFEGVSCENDYYGDSYEENGRRSFNQTHNNSFIDINETKSRRSAEDTEKVIVKNDPGICQNDHGGPIVTWAGSREILIGVASVFKVSTHSQCIGPYLFTSTLCTGLFLDCILTTTEFNTIQKQNSTRRDLCDRPARERGYETVEKHISWKDHPAGPSDNEKLLRSGKNKKGSSKMKHSSNKKYASNGQDPQDVKYPQNMRKPPLDRYVANLRNGPNVGYAPNVNNVPYAPNVKYAPNEGQPANMNNVPNYKYPPNANNGPHGNFPPNTNYAPNERNVNIQRYPDIDKYDTNQMNNGYAIPGQKVFPTPGRMGMNLYPAPVGGPPMRAQVPLHN